MGKTVPASKFTELQGLDRISIVVHEMHFLFREITKDDFGIDGEIEVVVPKSDGKGFVTTGGIIKVQSKSGTSYVKGDKEQEFFTPVEESDLKYWYNATFPVIFIVYHPGDDQLYWKDVRAFVRSTPNVWQKPYRITFNKATDMFSVAALEAVNQLAGASLPRVSFEQKERLFTNLLLVKRMPPLITSAQAKIKDSKVIRSHISGFIPPFRVIEDRLYTFADLRQVDCVLRDFCELPNINDVPLDRWVKDEFRRRDLVSLLNQLLGIHIRRCGLRYHPESKRNYFPRQNDEKPVFKQEWFNVRTSRAAPPRIVAKYYEYGIDRFWRHLASHLSFRYIGNSWFLQVIPRYFFTVDGQTPFDRDRTGPYTTRLKAQERNIHVLNHVLFWSDMLSMGKPAIEMQLDRRIAMVIEKMPYSGTANFAIPHDPAIYEEDDDSSSQLDFLSDMFALPEEEESDEHED
jgi:hypothetical protein